MRRVQHCNIVGVEQERSGLGIYSMYLREDTIRMESCRAERSHIHMRIVRPSLDVTVSRHGHVISTPDIAIQTQQPWVLGAIHRIEQRYQV